MTLALYLYQSLYRLAFRRRLNSARRKWEEKNLAKLRKYQRQWRMENKPAAKKAQENWRAKPKARKKMRLYQQKRSADFRARGLCGKCGKNPSAKWACPHCAEKYWGRK